MHQNNMKSTTRKKITNQNTFKSRQNATGISNKRILHPQNEKTSKGLDKKQIGEITNSDASKFGSMLKNVSDTKIDSNHNNKKQEISEICCCAKNKQNALNRTCKKCQNHKSHKNVLCGEFLNKTQKQNSVKNQQIYELSNSDCKGSEGNNLYHKIKQGFSESLTEKNSLGSEKLETFDSEIEKCAVSGRKDKEIAQNISNGEDNKINIPILSKIKCNEENRFLNDLDEISAGIQPNISDFGDEDSLKSTINTEWAKKEGDSFEKRKSSKKTNNNNEKENKISSLYNNKEDLEIKTLSEVINDPSQVLSTEESKTHNKSISKTPRTIKKYEKTKYFCKGKLLGLIVLLVNILVKTYKIEKGSSVVWDEAHFGKFGSKYLRREFYFDVHPPLGKMMTALSGYLFNQDKDFKFESATPYPESMDYVGMRRFHAVIGSLVALFAYGILRELERSHSYSFLFSLFFVFENGFTGISRLILLDSHLLLFTSATIYTFTKAFMDIHVRKCSWFKESYDLFLVGVCLGSVLSVKWIGCLTTALVGLFIIAELYSILMSKKHITHFLSKFLIRIVTLIIVPIALYLLFFLIHFSICTHSTPDEAHMSSLFQATLKNNSLNDSRKYVHFGSIVSIKSSRAGGGNLHSHASFYPNTNHRQITTYFHKDENNHWAFQKVIEDGEPVDVMRNGDEVVLMHVPTRGYLAHDDHPAYVGTGTRVYNNDGTLTRNCVFIVEIDHDVLKLETNVKTVTTRFHLRAKTSSHYLSITKKNYPSWGFMQGEVVMAKEKGNNTLWNIEENRMKPEDTAEKYLELNNGRNRFLNHVLELNVSMYNTNKGLVQDPNLEPVRIVSRPQEWFFLYRGLRMNSWDDDNTKFYMFGNPLTWYLSGISILAVPILTAIIFLRSKRKNKIVSKKKQYFYAYICFGGWAMHYWPFFFIGRVLYFHHYYPALFFAIFGIDFVIQEYKKMKKYLSFVIIVAIITYVFFSPLTYGIQGTPENLGLRKWRNTWDFK